MQTAYLKYLAVPYRHRGRDLSGWDCYGLYRYMLMAEQGVEIGSFETAYPSVRNRATDVAISEAILQNIVNWTRVEQGSEFRGCGVVFNIAGQPLHVGYILEPGTMLHAMEGRGTCIERYDSLNWVKRIEGIYKWN